MTMVGTVVEITQPDMLDWFKLACPFAEVSGDGFGDGLVYLRAWPQLGWPGWEGRSCDGKVYVACPRAWLNPAAD